MRNFALFAVCLLGSAAIAAAQVGEISVSGGGARFGGGNLGSDSYGVPVKVDGGFRLDLRLTLNTFRFFGHEIGYGYSRSTYKISGGDVAVPVHQGMYNFLVYATPEGAKIRPFGTAGVGFASFFPPGASAYYGNQITKFGVNYGGGVKVRVTPIIGVRFDIRQYATPQPFDFTSQSGWLRQTAFTGGVSFNF